MARAQACPAAAGRYEAVRLMLEEPRGIRAPGV